MVWSPLGQGPLTGKYPAGQAPPRTGANRTRPSARPRGPRGEARLESVEIQWHRLFMGFLVSCEGRWGGAPVCAPPPAHKPVSAPSAYADSVRYWSLPTFSATRLKKGAFTPSASVLQATSSVPAPPNAAWPIREILSLSFASLTREELLVWIPWPLPVSWQRTSASLSSVRATSPEAKTA